MSICAIMQPTFMPWTGYFNLIASVDGFVFLDDVPYQKRSWQVRNRICLNGAEHLLTVPVQKCSRGTLVKDVQLSTDASWFEKHINLLSSAYKKAPHGRDLLSFIDTTYSDNNIESLSDFNIKIIKQLCGLFKISTKLHIASEMSCPDHRSEHLNNICLALGAENYLSPIGSKEYLLEDQFESITGTKLSFHEFSPAQYHQYGRKEFLSHLSILDVIANIGFDNAQRYCEGKYEN
jgi:hypothetical protein